MLFVFYERPNLQGFHRAESAKNQENVTIVESGTPPRRCFRSPEPGDGPTCGPMNVTFPSREQDADRPVLLLDHLRELN